MRFLKCLVLKWTKSNAITNTFSFWKKIKKVYPDFPRLRTFNADGDMPNIHSYTCHKGDTNVATVFIFSQDLKSRKTVILLAVPGDNIGASAHEVKITAVKCAVVRVTHCPTDSNWFLHTSGEGTHHLALLILTTDDIEARARCWQFYYKWRRYILHLSRININRVN